MCSSYPQRTPVPAEYASNEPSATQPQITYICDLLDKRNLFAWPQWFDSTNAMDRYEYAAHVAHYKEEVVPAMTKKRASDLISFLLGLPWLPREEQGALTREIQEATGDRRPSRGTVHQSSNRIYVEYTELETDAGKKRVGRIVLPDGQKVLAGSYGIDTSTESNFTNQTTFFKVWVGNRGGWDVRMYVSDDTQRVQIAYGTKLWALQEIVKDPGAASRLFGLEFKRCGVCGRGLTNDLSRELGIGPVCRERAGW
jgi:hypothetical protein